MWSIWLWIFPSGEVQVYLWMFRWENIMLINLSFESSVFSSLGACTFRKMILHHWPLRTLYDTILLTNSTLLTAVTVLWCTKILFPIDEFHFLFHIKNYNPLLFTQPPTWRTILFWLSMTAYSIYSQLLSILAAVPPSATWGCVMPWWQGLTYHGLL